MTGSGYDWDLVLDPLRSCLVVMENFSSFSSSRDVRLQVLEERKLQVAQSNSTGYNMAAHSFPIIKKFMTKNLPHKYFS